MNRFYFLLGTAVLAAFGCGGGDTGLQEPRTDREAFVDSVLSTLTVEDKVGEMTQLTLDMLLVGAPYASEEPHRLDSGEVRDALVEWRVGSILNCGGHAYPPETWKGFITEIQRVAREEKASGIPVLYGIDAIHGATYTSGAVLGPQQIGLAATWDTSAVRTFAEHTAREVRSVGIPWNFSPVLDVGRDPRWPRFWETFGEDVLLASDMGEAMVRGYQEGPVPVAATMKHFLGYSQSLSGKDRTQAWIPERALRTYFLPTFQRAIASGAMSVMVNSGEINGIPVHADRWVLQDLLRKELGFEGVVVTDWEDVKYLYTRHKVAADYKDAVRMAVEAGIDMAMVPVDLEFPKLLLELVKEGTVAEARLDESVRRILGMKYDLGLFHGGAVPAAGSVDPSADPERPAFEALALRVAGRSMTLLRNDSVGAQPLLPLDPAARILVTGPTAHSLNALNGGWTGTWQGLDTTYNTPGRPTAWQAVSERWAEAGGRADFVPLAMDFDAAAIRTVQDAVARQRPTSVVVFCGEMPYTEKPGDLEDLNLPANQQDLVRALGATGVPVVLVYIGGRPRTFAAVESVADAVLMAYLPGDFGGQAIAQVLAGDIQPEGRLPFTWPRHPSSHAAYDHKYTDRIHTDFSDQAFQPLFAFGSGMGYAHLAITGVTTDRSTYGMQDTVRVTVRYEHAGGREGWAAAEVLQLFSQDSVASITPAVDQLRAWQRVEVAPGAQGESEFRLPVQELGFIGRDLKYVVEPGMFGLRVNGFPAVAVEVTETGAGDAQQQTN